MTNLGMDVGGLPVDECNLDTVYLPIFRAFFYKLKTIKLKQHGKE
jgi:hypothetical protein